MKKRVEVEIEDCGDCPHSENPDWPECYYRCLLKNDVPKYGIDPNCPLPDAGKDSDEE